jgi:cytochrome c peroxidase
MTRRRAIGLGVSVLLWGWVAACKQPVVDEPVTPMPAPSAGTPLDWKAPANFPAPRYDFKSNPLTKEGVWLGRTLFYDPTLSKDGTVSCGFCHSPFTAFSHTDHPLSHGIGGKQGTRNVPGIQNVAWRQTFFWDGSVTDLHPLPLQALQNPVEMGDTLPNVLAKLRSSGRYRPLFRAAFGSDSIYREPFLKALSQFMLTMVSGNSLYDRVVRNEAGASMSEAAQRGMALVRQKCTSCHAEPFLDTETFRNNGLLPLPTARTDDAGRFVVTKQLADRYKFRVPSLRNVEITPPYMHDGRFATLQQVLRHYATGISDSPYLDPLLKQTAQPGIPLTQQEQNDIIIFLTTLTDYTFRDNPDLQPLR